MPDQPTESFEPVLQSSGPPDVLGDRGYARIIAERLHDLQAQRAQLKVAMVANGHDLDDVVPGIDETYATRISDLTAAEFRISDGYRELMPLVREVAGLVTPPPPPMRLEQ